MTQRPNVNPTNNAAAAAQPGGSRLVRNPLRPVNSTLFTGWGPRILP